jgi:hypothetical protein
MLPPALPDCANAALVAMETEIRNETRRILIER